MRQFLLCKANKLNLVEDFRNLAVLAMDQVKYLAVSLILFLLGIWGIFLNRKNIIIMLMSIELMLLAVNMNFLLFSVYLDDLVGQVFALFVLTVAAAESAIGLALLVVYYRVRGTIAVEFINLLKG
jgi:NADH:ubiquinone oxidoreductase subunit K